MSGNVTLIRPSALRLLALLLGLLWVISGLAASFEVSSATTQLEGGVYRLSAQIEYRLSNVALDALQNGVPLTVAVS